MSPPLGVRKRLQRNRSRPDQLSAGDPGPAHAAWSVDSGWYLLLGTLSEDSQSQRDPERFAIRHYVVLTEALGLELRRPPSASSFFYSG